MIGVCDCKERIGPIGRSPAGDRCDEGKDRRRRLRDTDRCTSATAVIGVEKPGVRRRESSHSPRSHAERSSEALFYDYPRRFLFEGQARASGARRPPTGLIGRRFQLHPHRRRRPHQSTFCIPPYNRERERAISTHLRPLSRKCSNSTFSLQHSACLKKYACVSMCVR